MYDLNSLLISGSGVTNLNVGIYGNSINDLGQIGATGSIAGQDYAPPLTPVGIPEPSTPLLLAIAIAGFLSRRIRSSRIVSLSLSVV